MIKSLACLLLLVAVVAAQDQTTHYITNWAYGNFQSDITMYPGDTISVTWSGAHTFSKFPTDAAINCNDFSTATNLAVGTSATWFADGTFAGHNVGFACSVSAPAHCQNGMAFVAHVKSPDQSVTWGDSVAAKPAIEHVSQGDSLLFDYTGTTENVYVFFNKSAFDACDFGSSSAVCVDGGPCTHVFNSAPAGMSAYFGSQGGDGACGGNRKVEVKFSAANTVAASVFSLFLGLAVFITNKRF